MCRPLAKHTRTGIRALLLCTLLLLGRSAAAQPPTNPTTTVPCTGITSVVVTGASFTVTAGASTTIRGCNFGAGVGTVRLCNASTFAGSTTCVVQPTSSWGATLITISSVTPGTLPAMVYWYVQTMGGQINSTAPFAVNLSIPPPPTGTTYYVRTDGNNANTGLTNTAGGAWQTIDFAASNTTVAGDIVRVQAGTYVEAVTPTRNGTAGNTITFVADGVVTLCGVDWSNNSDQRWIGFIFDGNDPGCGARVRVLTWGGTNTRLEYWHTTIRDGQDGASVCCEFVNLSDRLNDSVLIGNTFVALTNGAGIVHYGSHSLFGYNDFSNITCDATGIAGNYNRWLNNYAHALNDGGCHSDFFQYGSNPLGLGYNLFEGNFQVGQYAGNVCPAAGCDEHTTIIQNNQPERCTGGVIAGCDLVIENLWRRNVVHQIGSGSWSMAVSTPPVQMTFGRYLNNTDALVNQAADTASNGNVCCAFYHAADVDRIYIRHHIEYKAWAPVLTATNPREVYTVEATNYDVDRNLAYDPDFATPLYGSFWAAQANKITQQDPLFTNVGADDFTLQAGSPARNAGSSLCLTNGGGTGTTITLDANCTGYFRGPDAQLLQYGGAITSGDTIRIGTDIVTVVSTAGDTVTVAPAITWVDNDPVYWGTSSTPDIGAYPYKASGYTLTGTYTLLGGVLTVTPNDADLVRMLVVFLNGIPVCVDQTSPFGCTGIGAGTVVARMYKRYPSKAPLWVDATP